MVVTSACSSSKTPHNKGDITESEWGLISIVAKNSAQALVPDKNNIPTLEVSSKGTIHGTTGCNSFEGEVAITGYSLKFGNIIATHVKCPNIDIENALYNSLDSIDNYTVERGHLLLKKGNKVFATFMSMDVR